MAALTLDSSSALPGPDWLRSRRTVAAERFAAAELPTGSEEVWRYSRIGELDLAAYRPPDPSAPEPATGEVPAEAAPFVGAVGARAALVVVVDGRVAHVDVDPALAARGLSVGPLAEAPDGDDLLGAVAQPADPFADLNLALVTAPVLVRVPAGLVVPAPVLVVHVVTAAADGTILAPRTVVVAGPDSESTVVEHHCSADVAALVVPVTELDVAAAARLRHVTVQELGPRVWQVGYQGSRVARDATLVSQVAALGGDYARVRTDSRLVGAGATANLLAVYFGEGHQMHDFRTLQDHVAPSTTSELLFKGAVEDEAQSVYSGLIRVGKDAPKTNALQTNRALVLSEGAGAESVPNLEIENNDVRCSHASAVGPIDDDQRYYLESRGLPPEVAERLIVLGFFAEVVERVAVPGLADWLRRAVAGKLDRRAP